MNSTFKKSLNIIIMGKRDKEHRKKIAKRNEQIIQQRKSFEKKQRDFLMRMIEQEKNNGLFKDNPTLPSITPPTTGPQI